MKAPSSPQVRDRACERSVGAGGVSVRVAPWRPSPTLILWVVGLSVVRLIAGGLIPLTDDEAYYRLWAAHPSLGYFDHPPMIAWWIAIGRRVFGDTPVAVRLLPTISTAVVTLLIADIGRLLGLSKSTSDRAGVWYNATLLVALAGEVGTPDAPATLFWTATIWAIARAWASGVGAWWVLAGLAGGLAALSKYSAFFIAPGVFLWLIHSKERRRDLLRPFPWIALVLGVLVFTPNVVWNAQHGWLSFVKQFSRVGPSRFTPVHVIDFPATQFILLNPIVAVFAAMGVLRAVKHEPTRLLVLSIAPFFIFLVVQSLHAGIQAHWTAPLYPPLVLLAADVADGQCGAAANRAVKAVPWVGFGLAAVVMLHIALPQTDWFGSKDAVMTLRGWPALADRVEARRRDVGAKWVGTFNYTTAAKLLNEKASSFPLVQLNQRERYGFEGPQAPLAGRGLVIELNRRVQDVDVKDCFGRFMRLPDLNRGDPGRTGVAYAAYLVWDPRVDLMQPGCILERDRPTKIGASLK